MFIVSARFKKPYYGRVNMHHSGTNGGARIAILARYCRVFIDGICTLCGGVAGHLN